MSDLKLYTVTLSAEIVVLAESKEEAEDIALHGSDDAIDHLDADAQPMGHMPSDWDGSEIPFGECDEDAPDRTVGEWIELGAAPEYTALRERLARAARAAGEKKQGEP